MTCSNAIKTTRDSQKKEKTSKQERRKALTDYRGNAKKDDFQELADRN